MCYKIPGRTFDPWKDKTVMRRNIELRNVLIRGEDKFQYGAGQIYSCPPIQIWDQMIIVMKQESLPGTAQERREERVGVGVL